MARITKARLAAWIGWRPETLKTLGTWLLCLLVLCGVWLAATLYFLENARTANLIRLTAHRLRVHELEARRSEKDFLLRSLSDLAFLKEGRSPYLERHRTHVEALRREIGVLADRGNPPGEVRARHLRELVNDYETGFDDLVMAYRKRGSREWGLEGELASAFDRLEASVERLKSPAIERVVLGLSRNEQGYLLHRSAENAARVRADMTSFRRALNQASLAEARDALERTDAYEAAFVELENLDARIGFDEDSGLQKRFRDSIRSVEPVVEEVLTDAVRADEDATRTLRIGILGTCLIIATLLAMAIFFGQAARLRNRRLLEASRQMEEDHRRLLQAERLAAIGQMVTGLAHESRNAFQRTHACLDMLTQEVKDRPAAQDLVKRIEDSQDHLHLLYEQVREYAAPIKVELKTVRMREVVMTAWRRLDLLHGSRRVRLDEHLETTDDGSKADAFAVEQVFRNIFENSLQACRDPVVIDVHYRDARLEGRPALEVSVFDNGPGLDAEQKSKIFDPFFTTKVQGTGLGMAIAKRLVEAHGGVITVGSTPRPGAHILVTIPRRQETAP